MFNELPPTDEENEDYKEAVNNLNTLKNDIANGDKFANA